MPNITIGIDAELIFSQNGRLVSASSVVPNSVTAPFGVDGCSSTAEIRPRPDTDPKKVVASVQRIMKAQLRVRPNLNTLRWNGGSYACSQPIGAHIHFGTGRLPSSRTVDYLDSLLAIFVYCMDDVNEVNRRNSCGYGLLTSYRSQPWGWEYRTLPSFITEKRLTIGVLALAKVIVEHCEYGALSTEEETAFSEIKVSTADHSFASLSKNTLKRSLEKRIKFIKKYMPEYRNHPAIGYVFSRAKLGARGQYTLNHKDIKENWKIGTPFVKPTMEQVMFTMEI
jgi:hypothetical protein